MIKKYVHRKYKIFLKKKKIKRKISRPKAKDLVNKCPFEKSVVKRDFKCYFFFKSELILKNI